MDENSIREQYRDRQPLLERLQTEVRFILEEKVKASGIKIHSITSRIKSADSFVEKVTRREAKEPFSEIQDLIGARIVCLFVSDIPKLGALIHNSFKVISEDNKMEGSEVSSFGYMSVHFVAQLKKQYRGPRYDDIVGLPFEIQVRTIAMDSWATISHYLDYKTESDVPKELRRDFFALSGLFYVADTHFESFFRARKESKARATKLFKESGKPPQEEINLDTVSAYLKRKLPDRQHSGNTTLSELVSELIAAGYRTTTDLDRVLNAASVAFQAFEKRYPPASSEGIPRFEDAGVVRTSLDLYDEKYAGRWKKQERIQELATYRKLIKKE